MRQLLRHKLRQQFATSIKDKIRQQRQSRLSKGPGAASLTTKALDDMMKIRNIGIIAHIDAGKTTTTERMLYYAGALPSPGNIDEGTTTMDYLAQQKQRGITIRSAAISFNWSGNQINLIDTPGHVDFSGQVSRSLRVLDGVVTILDAVKGVQSQTLKVWAQASHFNLPKICYLNKMDRIGASYQQALDSLTKKLGVQPLLLQYPVGDGDNFRGVIDLLQLEEILFEGDYGQDVRKTKLAKNTQKHNTMLKMRQKIVQTVANYDDEVGEMYLSEQFVPATKLRTAIRRIMTSKQKNNNITPVLLGSSFKNKGVQPILDSVISYLPSPMERNPIKSCDPQEPVRKPNKDQPLTAYVFKVLFDFEKGPLAYTRIYSGQLAKNLQIFNASKRVPEKMSKILRVRANQYVPINQLNAGDIVAISGLKQTTAGDTLTTGADSFTLQSLDVPKPIFTAPFELSSGKYQRQFDEAMNKAIIEDTSLSYEYEVETNQYLVSGLGELHLQILKDRLVSQKIPVKMGKLKINFKETVNKQHEDCLEIKKEISVNNFEEFNISIKIVPLRTGEGKIQQKNQVIFTFDRVNEFDDLWNQFVNKKKFAKNPRANSGVYSKDQLNKMKKNVRNPTPIEPLYEQDGEQREENYDEDDDDEDEDQVQTKRNSEEELYYHMNTLPFETLYELYEACHTALLYGRKKLPAMGIQLQIKNGKYKKSSFSKSVMNRCASTLTRSLVQKTSALVEPFMEFNLSGEQAMIDYALKDVLRKRGRIEQQTQNSLHGFIPAEGVRGWIKELRSMGLQIQLKFSEYEQVIGVNPEQILQKNQ